MATVAAAGAALKVAASISWVPIVGQVTLVATGIVVAFAAGYITYKMYEAYNEPSSKESPSYNQYNRSTSVSTSCETIEHNSDGKQYGSYHNACQNSYSSGYQNYSDSYSSSGYSHQSQYYAQNNLGKQINPQKNHDRKYLKSKTLEQILAGSKRNKILQLIGKLLKQNQKQLKRVLQWAKSIQIFLNWFFKKVQKAMRKNSSQAIKKLFEQVDKSGNQLESEINLEKRTAASLTPEKLIELLDKIKQLHTQPVRNRQLQDMLVSLFARVEQKIAESTAQYIENPMVKEAMALINSITRELTLQLEELEQIRLKLNMSRQTSKQKMIDKKRIQQLKQQLELSKHSIHHVIPFAWIKNMLQGMTEHLLQKDLLQLYNKILKHPINQKYKDSLFDKVQAHQKNPNSKQNIAAVLANSLVSFCYWNPRNLVVGALNIERNNDPGSQVDQEIVDAQSQAYRSAIATLQQTIQRARTATSNQQRSRLYAEGLMDFCTLPWPVNGKWVKEQNGKYRMERREAGDQKLGIKVKYDPNMSIQDVVALIKSDQSIIRKQQKRRQEQKKTKEQALQKEQKVQKGGQKEKNEKKEAQRDNGSNQPSQSRYRKK